MKEFEFAVRGTIVHFFNLKLTKVNCILTSADETWLNLNVWDKTFIF